MNIFKILSSYDGSIKEPNISSFLAYLLDLSEDHGMSDLLLRSIVADFKEKYPESFSTIKNDLTEYDIQINPEYSVRYYDERKDIDIVIEIYSENKEEPFVSFCFENKITDASISKKDNQLEKEYEGLKASYKENNWNTPIAFCYLTLEDTKKSNDEFEKLSCDNKIHLYWKGENSIQAKILNILEQERIGEIDPISEDSKFLIKSFLAFIKTDFKSYEEDKTNSFERKKYGKIMMDYFRDYYSNMKENTDYKVSEIKSEIISAIQKASGQKPNPGTLRCHFYATTVNDINRLYYNVTQKNAENKNLFYYPDERNRNIVRKYTNSLKNVNVYIKE